MKKELSHSPDVIRHNIVALADVHREKVWPTVTPTLFA